MILGSLERFIPFGDLARFGVRGPEKTPWVCSVCRDRSGVCSLGGDGT